MSVVMEKKIENHKCRFASLTLQETADMLGLTRERVRQIEKRALAKIKKELGIRYGAATYNDTLWM